MVYLRGMRPTSTSACEDENEQTQLTVAWSMGIIVLDAFFDLDLFVLAAQAFGGSPEMSSFTYCSRKTVGNFFDLAL